MRALVLALVALSATGCIEEIDARWQLDHDHVVAVRASPPRVMPLARARLDALIAHAGAPTTVESPSAAVGPQAPDDPLYDTVAFIGDGWYVTSPGEPALARARVERGLPDGAPVPLDVLMAFERAGAATLYAKKTVWLGAQADNPTAPAMVIDGQAAADEVVVPIEQDVYVSVTPPPGARVNWLTSAGSLFQDDVPTAFLRVSPEDRTDGELAVVIRDADGGVAWRVWPLHAQR